MLYAASVTTTQVADGRTVKLIEETNYPFEENVTFTIETEEEVRFPLYLRIPAWAKGATFSVNGEKQMNPTEPGQYARVERTWKKGDFVELRLPMNITTKVWTANKSSVSVNYGPLTLSLKINERYDQRDSRDHEIVQDDSHWQEGVDASKWPAYEIFAESDWNYALCVDDRNMPVDITVERKAWPEDNFPFTLESVPLVFKAKGKKIPSWSFDSTGMTDTLPSVFKPRAEEVEEITLVPMGAARLRISAFPRDTEATTVDPDC